MQLIINIDEETYKKCKWKNNGVVGLEWWERAIANGIPLPKGHGRISDMDAAIKCIQDVEGEDAIWAIALINWACGKRTIIKADKESE